MTRHTKPLLFSILCLSLLGCDKSAKVSPIVPAQAENQVVTQQAFDKETADQKALAQETTAVKKASFNKNEKKQKTQRPKAPLKYKTIEWTDLMPKEDLDALMNPPSYITEVEDGSLEDQLSSQMANAIDAATTNKQDKYQQALVSTKIIKEMDGKAIRLPGFIVPLEFDDNQVITQFFLVPFFGACIHLPPPPPNQTIFVNYPDGLKLDTLVDPIWISGVLQISMTENDMARSAYSIEMYEFEKYTEE